MGEDSPTFQSSRKRATNVSIDEQLLVEAKSLGINLSQTLEKRLQEVVGDERARRWALEHREALKILHDDIEQNGLWSDDFRKF